MVEHKGRKWNFYGGLNTNKALEKESNGFTTKVRVNSRANVSVLVKNPDVLKKNLASLSVGLHGSNLINDKRSFQVGGQVEFNV